MDESQKQLHEFCFRASLNEAASELSVMRVYYWWKLRRSITLALKKIDLKPGLVVDIGCGAGDITRLAFNVLGPQWNYLATDLSEVSLAFADINLKRFDIPITTKLGNASEGIPTETHSATVVVCSEVLEHIPEPSTLIQEVHRILKPGGIGIFTTPNPTNSLLNALKQLRGQKTHATKTPDIDTTYRADDGHVSVLDRREWTHLFDEGGFDLVKTYRGALVFGHARHERNPFIVGIYIAVDALLDWIPGSKDACEDICYVFRKR